MNALFRIYVQEVFRFADGSVVLAGEVKDGPSFIDPGTYEIAANGVAIGSVRLAGEMIGGRVPKVRSIKLTAVPEADVQQWKNLELQFSLLEHA